MVKQLRISRTVNSILNYPKPIHHLFHHYHCPNCKSQLKLINRYYRVTRWYKYWECEKCGYYYADWYEPLVHSDEL